MKCKGKWRTAVVAAVVALLLVVPVLSLQAQQAEPQKTNLWNWSSLTKGPLGDKSNFVAVSAGGHVMLLDASGRLWALGSNRNGTLGDGTRLDKKEPIPIGTKSDWVNIAAGLYHSAAVDASGRLWTWGLSHYGILGMDTGGDTWKLTPTLVDNRTDWAAVSVGIYHTVALGKSGRLWGWGQNAVGQLGDDDIGRNLFGTRVNQLTPARIGNKSDWVTVSAGNGHSVAIDAGGSLWAWGYNEVGQLGDGTRVNRNTPTRIGTRNDWVAASAGILRTAAITRAHSDVGPLPAPPHPLNL